MAMCAASPSGDFGLQTTATVLAPSARAYSAGGDAYDNIFFGRLLLRDFFAAQFAGVFVGFHGCPERLWPAGDDELDHTRVHVKGGRTFDGVESGDASAGASAYVEEAPAFGERRGDQLDGLRNLPESSLHGGRNLGIFSIDDAGDFRGRLAIEIYRSGVCFLGTEASEFYGLHSAVQGFALRSVAFQACFPRASITAS
jgi:hypothetical protein